MTKTASIHTASTYTRSDVRFSSGDSDCAAWLYRPNTVVSEARPAIVLGHGLGAIKEMGLDAYASRFVEAGYVVIAFDYRHFGGSGGMPRQLLDIKRQLADWAAAIAYTRTLSGVDTERVALFGSSFGGGHVIVAAARDARVAAVIAQCPFTSGTASALTLGVMGTIKVSALALRDTVGAAFGAQPVMVPLAGAPGEGALMNAPDVMPGYNALKPSGMNIPEQVAARIGLQISLHHPGRHARKVQCPILFCVCDPDTVAPTGPTLRYAAQAPRGEIRHYPFGHFDIYKGKPFERAIADQLDFLRRHLPVHP